MTAWVCLAVALLTGLAPVHGFVVCIEADGCVRIETKAPDVDCGGCDDHGSEGIQSEFPATTSDDACPCIDIQVPGFPREERLLPQACDSRFEFVGAPPLVTTLLTRIAFESGAFTPRPETPRAHARLAHIRTVVLLR